jgi:hypothetical protein
MDNQIKNPTGLIQTIYFDLCAWIDTVLVAFFSLPPVLFPNAAMEVTLIILHLP